MKYRQTYKEFESVSIRSENEILGLAKLLSAPHPLTYEELWNVYTYNGKRMRGEMTYQQMKRLKDSLKEKGIVEEGKREEELSPDEIGFDSKDYIEGQINRKTLEVNYEEWLYPILEDIEKFDTDMKFGGRDILHYLERLYRSTLIQRKVLDPNYELIEQDDVGGISIKDLAYNYDVSNGEVRAFYSYILWNLPMLIVLVRAIEKDVKIQLRNHRSLRDKVLNLLEEADTDFRENFLNGTDIVWEFEKGEENEKGIHPEDVRAIKHKLYESNESPATENELEELDELMKPLLVSWISAHFDQVVEGLEEKDLSNVNEIKIKPNTFFLRQLTDMMTNETTIWETVVES